MGDRVDSYREFCPGKEEAVLGGHTKVYGVSSDCICTCTCMCVCEEGEETEC